MEKTIRHCGPSFRPLTRHPVSTRHLYYFNSKKQGELDFLLERDAEIIPLEVKPGKYFERHNAITNVMGNPEYDIQQAILLCNENLHVEGKVLYAPIYMLMFMHQRVRAGQSIQIPIAGIHEAMMVQQY